MLKARSFKKAMLGTALAGALVVGAGYGTYSWYTAEVTASGSIENTTFQLNNATKSDLGQLFDGKLAPSRATAEKSVTIENTGDEAMYLRGKFNFNVSGGSADEATLLGGYFVKPTLLYNGSVVALPSSVDADGDGWIKVSDLQSVLDKWLPSDSGLTSAQFKSGDKAEVKLQVKLSQDADNRWQGASFTGNFAVQGKQIDAGAQFEN